MPLVDYGSSGESSGEENDTEDIKTDNKIKLPAEKTDVEKEGLVNDDNLFSSLPKPRGHVALHGNLDRLENVLFNKSLKDRATNKQGPAKITVPSLSDFDNDDTPKTAVKKILPSTKGAGLFDVLPPPKNIPSKEAKRPLIPHVIKHQMSKLNANSVNKKHGVRQEKSNITNQCGNIEEDDDDEFSDLDGSASGSYFGEGISCSNQSAAVDYTDGYNITPDIQSSTLETSCVTNEGNNDPYSFTKTEPINGDIEAECLNVPTNSEPLELDEKALQILCGGKRKRNQMPVNIIDLSGEEIMPDSKEWLLKQLTEEKATRGPSHKKHNGPSVQSRRKHQITYLAYQAKAQELELQNQWSQNRMSRRQTQSKYGF